MLPDAGGTVTDAGARCFADPAAGSSRLGFSGSADLLDPALLLFQRSADEREVLGIGRSRIQLELRYCSAAGDARRRSQTSRDRKIVAAEPAKQASPQVPKLSVQAPRCDVPPNWSSVTPKRSVPRNPPPKPTQEYRPSVDPLCSWSR
jgi:hypothetical protein